MDVFLILVAIHVILTSYERFDEEEVYGKSRSEIPAFALFSLG
jgi:hypothetical protein